MQRVLLVDGLNLVRRIFEARGGLGDAGFIDSCGQSLTRCLQDLSPSHGVVVWDSQDTTWRHLLDDQYKANRSATPETLLAALPELKAAFSAMHVASLTVPNYEADDVIATMAATLAKANAEAVILSTDKMFYPLLLTGAAIYHQFDRQFVNRVQVEEKYGLGLEQLVDYWALSGDNSNNIKGVPGVGKKSATELLQAHGSVSEILKLDLANAKGPLKKVNEHREALQRCKQLVALKTDVELGINLKEFRIQA